MPLRTILLWALALALPARSLASGRPIVRPVPRTIRASAPALVLPNFSLAERPLAIIQKPLPPAVQRAAQGAPLPTSLVLEAASQSRLLAHDADMAQSLARYASLARFAASDDAEMAEAGRASAEILKTLLNPARGGKLLDSLDPADAGLLTNGAALIDSSRGKDANLEREVRRARRLLARLAATPGLDGKAAGLAAFADGAGPAGELSPNLVWSENPSRRILLAQQLPEGAQPLDQAVGGVELPPVLAYKAAAIALRDDLRGAFSEIGAAQKISGDFYKIPGQKAIAVSLSPYSREASDARYGLPNANPTSEDYTSLRRLRQQLETEFSAVPAGPGKRRFAVANSARTSWGNGHAWLGVRAELSPGKSAEVVMHVRLFGARTRNQKDVLGALGVNLLYGVYNELSDTEKFLSSLKDGIRTADFEIDYLSLAGPDHGWKDGPEVARALIRHGLARQALLAPGGAPIAPSEAAARNKNLRWTLLREGRAESVVASEQTLAAPPQGEPILVDVVDADSKVRPRPGRWTLLSRDPESARQHLQAAMFPAPRAPPAGAPASPLSALDHQNVIDFKAKRVNREGFVKGIFADIGGYQSIPTRFFEASNSWSISDVISFPRAEAAADRYGAQGAASDADYLDRAVDQDFEAMLAQASKGSSVELHYFALGARAKANDVSLSGIVRLKIQKTPGSAETQEISVSFRFTGGTWQHRRNALAALGVNLLYAVRFFPDQLNQAALGEGMPYVKAELRLTPG